MASSTPPAVPAVPSGPAGSPDPSAPEASEASGAGKGSDIGQLIDSRIRTMFGSTPAATPPATPAVPATVAAAPASGSVEAAVAAALAKRDSEDAQWQMAEAVKRLEAKITSLAAGTPTTGSGAPAKRKRAWGSTLLGPW